MEMAAKTCLTCNKPLKGRSDKKFCDDYCRNSYNNKLQTEDNAIVKSINQTLKRNRKILQELLGNEDVLKCTKSKILAKGFQFGYFTHQFMNKKGNVYHFCYEYGYLFLEEDQVLIVKRKPELR